MITSTHNPALKAVRKLHDRRGREATGRFVAEGEDQVAAALAAGWNPVDLFVAHDPAAAADIAAFAAHPRAREVDAAALAAAGTVGSGARVVGVFEQRWSAPGGRVCLYLHGVGDPGNVGTLARAALAFCDGPIVLGPGCADPFSPKAVRASAGAIFARPPARATLAVLDGARVALDASATESLDVVATRVVAEGEPLIICVGAEREGLPAEIVREARYTAAIPMRAAVAAATDSLNAAVAGAIAAYVVDRALVQSGVQTDDQAGAGGGSGPRGQKLSSTPRPAPPRGVSKDAKR